MRVLIVDDDPQIRATLRLLLEHAELHDDVELAEAADGPAALTLLEASPVDVVLLDVMLPGASGLQVLARIRSRPPLADVPVVMLTARAGEGDRVMAFRTGADAYLTKPFDIDDLSAVLADVLSRGPRAQAAVRERELGRAELLAQIEQRFPG